jgi:hypothetical protein
MLSSFDVVHGDIYRVILEERSIIWEVIVSVIVRKKVHMNVCLILNGYRNRACVILFIPCVLLQLIRQQTYAGNKIVP